MWKKFFLSTVGALAVCVSAASAQTADELGIPGLEEVMEAGYAATFTCSGVFIAGRSPDQINALELSAADGRPNFYTALLNSAPATIDIDYERKIVSASFDDAAPPIRAAFRDGLGCSILPLGAGPDAAAALPRLSKKRPHQDKSETAWPKRGPIQPASEAKPYQEGLDAVVERAFGREAYGVGSRTVSVLVVHKGEVVAERYGRGFGPHTQYRTWSTAKSFANAVVGVAIEDGVLPDVSSPAPVPEWAKEGDKRQSITIENLLHMASGLKTVVPRDGSNTPLAYTAGIDTATDAASLSLIHEPGAKWHYSNYDTLLLLRSVKTALGDLQSYVDFPYERLFDRIGMHDTFAETDPYGNYVMSSQVYTTARDLARFAYLYLNDGKWGRKRILPEGWAQYSCTPITAEYRLPDHMRYGAQWWMYDLKFDESDGIENFRICSTNGARGQFAAFAPEHDLVIVRQGVDEWGPDGFEEDIFFEDVVRAVAGRR
ncbi:MAG: serine hydrolase [Pseudomonadota bacterium]